MQVRNIPGLPRRSPIIAALAALVSCAACADEPSPWYIGATLAATHDSNVNRISDGVVDPKGRADTYSSVGLVGGFDQSYARQRFYSSANVTYNKYNNHSDLDNTSYGLNAGWDWASIWNLSGGVYASASQGLAQLNGNNGPVQTTQGRNLLRTEQIGTSVSWGGPGALSIQGAYTHSRVSYSEPTSFGSNSTGDTASLGLYHHVGPTLTTGIAYRLTRTDTAGQNPGATTSNGRNIDLSADWRYTVQTGVNARLSFTRQSNPGGSGQDFSGLTGALAATYAPTGKLSFNAAYNRDAGTNGSFFNVPITSTPGTTTPATGTTTTFYQNSTVGNTFLFGANYAATAKIGVNANYSYRTATVSNSLGGASGDYKDNVQSTSLGVSWAIARAWSLGCHIAHEKRNAQTVPVFAYTDNLVGCSAQVTLR